ncbi:AraC family transcriptional regulator [Emticicia sp. 21SJ11W-3]|uniref:AraC family transcriptional regulator n=1 Tax=Emticicia sp. 21SJ11W-3 TaxID=2916755 RepID=UPI0020A0BBED|nr:AraC family transcriptional regulator [Emticicia sp. 21SJ11W-3]UTA67135.1 AraC family transcriptional regulator [Emticicia sp. 21SJ11W-3]
MKPHFHKVPTNTGHSFSIRHDIKPNFGSIWHYHPELELHYVIKGEGVRFIGDNVSNFSSGEVLLLGENLPHTWRCNKEYFQGNADLQVEAIVMQFMPDCLGGDFLNLNEAYAIRKLYEKAKQGLLIKGNTAQRLKTLMEGAVNAGPLQRLVILLSVLELLTESDELEMITAANAFYQSNEMETVRLNNVCSYTLANYAKDISLEDIAAIANLSTTSFCRYFKLMTHKTYNDFLTEVRVSHACRALIENKLSIEIICFDSGFNNLSNFYRHFRKVKGTTPLEYKKQYLKSEVAG